LWLFENNTKLQKYQSHDQSKLIKVTDNKGTTDYWTQIKWVLTISRPWGSSKESMKSKKVNYDNAEDIWRWQG